MGSFLRLAAVLLVALASASAAGGGEPLGRADGEAVKAAFKAIEAGDWARAMHAARAIQDPTAAKIFQWLDITRFGATASFTDVTRFMAANHDWPNQDLLERRAEEGMSEAQSDGEILVWFKDRQPVSTDGRVRLGAALLAGGKAEAGRALLRSTWIEGDFGKRQETQFYRKYRSILSAADHRARLDRLIWEDRYWPAQRMLYKVDAGYRALAQARLMLLRLQGNVDHAIERIPKELRNDPGLIYERLRWRRRKDLDSAYELLDDPSLQKVYPHKWWDERAILARRALQKGHISEAYRLARDHALKEGEAFAEAEWLAGWIALRFLGEPKTAFQHFTAMAKSVKYPISRARGAYWAARAAEEGGKDKLSRLWYRLAARFYTTYYGQLAGQRLAPGRVVRMRPEPEPEPGVTAAFASHELAQVLRILTWAGEKDRMRPFVLRLAGVQDSPAWLTLSAKLAREVGRPDLAIAVARKASQTGQHLIASGYPTMETPPVPAANGKSVLEVPLVLAVIRQESAFHTEAQSSAGARGLMQLLPNTARDVANSLKVDYAVRRLTSEPEFNLRIGQTYLLDLLDTFDGSYVLALAAYNAGPARARRWVELNGHPRDDAVDVVDWIEMIPFAETRNYIQRVMEGLQVYRGRLNGMAVSFKLESDLKR